MWAGSLDPRGKITVISVLNCLHFSGIFAVYIHNLQYIYTQFTNVALGWRPMLYTMRSVRVDTSKNAVIITKQTTFMSIIKNIRFDFVKRHNRL